MRAWFSPKPEPTIMTSGEVQIIHDQEIIAEDSVQVLIKETGEIVEIPVKVPAQPVSPVREYKFSIKHENFLIEGLVYCNNLQEIKITRFKYVGTVRIDVLSNYKPRITSITPNLTTNYLPDESVRASRIPWIQLILIAGATTREPYQPLLLGGIGFERYLPKLMLGGGVVEMSPIIWIGKAWRI